MAKKVQKYPLMYILAEQILNMEIDRDKDKDDKFTNQNMKSTSNKQAEQFLSYIKSIQYSRDIKAKQNSNQVNHKVHAYYTNQKQRNKSEQYMRNIMQGLSLNLTPAQAEEIFPKAMKQFVANPGEEKKNGRQVYQEMYQLMNYQGKK